jgi:hypothetical protein
LFLHRKGKPLLGGSFDVSMSVEIYIPVFWVTTDFTLLGVYQYFEGTHYFHLQGHNSEDNNMNALKAFEKK